MLEHSRLNLPLQHTPPLPPHHLLHPACQFTNPRLQATLSRHTHRRPTVILAAMLHLHLQDSLSRMGEGIQGNSSRVGRLHRHHPSVWALDNDDAFMPIMIVFT